MFPFSLLGSSSRFMLKYFAKSNENSNNLLSNKINIFAANQGHASWIFPRRL